MIEKRVEDVKPKVLVLAFALAAVAGACNEQRNFAGECQADADCPVGSACKITGVGDSVGICICRSDEACNPGEECNSQGVCQARSGCRTTADCADEPNTYCDVGSGDCIALTKCGSLVHCDPGFVCDPASGTCVAGCYGHGDCQLYSACTVTDGSALGACLSGTCGDKSFCDYGEVCNNGTCAPFPSNENCQPCENGPAECPSPNGFCLTNNQYDPNRPETGASAFCSTECNDEANCPNGYNCVRIVVPTQNECTQNSDCNPGSECRLGEAALRGWCTCQSNEECSPDRFPGQCQRSCGGFGLRACMTDADCTALPCQASCAGSGAPCQDDSQCAPIELCQNNLCITDGRPCSRGNECLCSGGSCLNSGRTCTTAADCTLTCQDGGCLIGAGCAPSEGLLCPELRP